MSVIKVGDRIQITNKLNERIRKLLENNKNRFYLRAGAFVIEKIQNDQVYWLKPKGKDKIYLHRDEFTLAKPALREKLLGVIKNRQNTIKKTN